MTTSQIRRPARYILALVALTALLTGCQPATPAAFEAEFEQIPGVDYAIVGGVDVKAGLEYGITAGEADAAILAVRDLAIDRHEKGHDVSLTVVILAEPDDEDGATHELYYYGTWYSGTVTAADFSMQAAFLASLGEWHGLEQSAATVEQVSLEVFPDSPAKVTVGQTLGAGNDPADIAVLVADLAELWVASGGDLDAVHIR